jgi:hypothetical protein
MLSSRMRAAAAVTLTALIALTLCSCASGPQPPQPGSAQYHWAAAATTYKNGEYSKVVDNLQVVLKTDNEFKTRAYPWALIMTSGLAKGYMDYADSQDIGGKVNRNNPTPFRKAASAARTAAGTYAMHFVQVFHDSNDKIKDEQLPLAFDFPPGMMVDPPQMEKVAKGMTLQQTELDAIQKSLIQRGILQSLCRLMGTPNDSAKALNLFKQGDPKAPRVAVQLGVANLLWDQAQVFGPKALDKPQTVKVLSTEAMEALKALPASKETKDLTGKIQANLKKLKLT